jgi:ubiquinone/menaquinone biosynthesis C-methylase UbiE
MFAIAKSLMHRTLESTEELDGGDSTVYTDLADKRSKWTDPQFVREALALGVQAGNALDLGCGPGHITIRLAQSAPELKVWALDLAPDMLAIVREKAKQAALSKRVRTCLGDMCELPFPDETFDLVVSQFALHHLPEPERGLAEIRRVLKPNGAFIIRDLLRPTSRLHLEFLVRGVGSLQRYGREGKKQYRESLLAALNWREIQELTWDGVELSKLRVLSHFFMKKRGGRATQEARRLKREVPAEATEAKVRDSFLVK